MRKVFGRSAGSTMITRRSTPAYGEHFDGAATPPSAVTFRRRFPRDFAHLADAPFRVENLVAHIQMGALSKRATETPPFFTGSRLGPTPIFTSNWKGYWLAPDQAVNGATDGPRTVIGSSPQILQNDSLPVSNP